MLALFSGSKTLPSRGSVLSQGLDRERNSGLESGAAIGMWTDSERYIADALRGTPANAFGRADRTMKGSFRPDDWGWE